MRARDHFREHVEIDVCETPEPNAALSDSRLADPRLRLLGEIAALVDRLHVHADPGLVDREADATRVTFTAALVAIVILAVSDHRAGDVRLERGRDPADERVERFDLGALRLRERSDVVVRSRAEPDH